MKSTIKSIIRFLINSTLPQPQHPILDPKGLNLKWKHGVILGHLYQIYFQIRHALGIGPRVIFGKRISIQGGLRTVGPGTIILGDDIIVGVATDLYTHSKESRITIGPRTFLNGTRMGCDLAITVGADCILADVRIMDTDFHPLSKDRMINRNATIQRNPIQIGNNVWIAAASGILRGVQIGNDSVIGYGSVVAGSIPEGVIAAGNPAKVIKPID